MRQELEHRRRDRDGPSGTRDAVTPATAAQRRALLGNGARASTRRSAIAVFDVGRERVMREQDRPVVVLVERKASDEDVMREARARIVMEAAPLVLVHVAPLASAGSLQDSRWQRPPEPWQRILGLEAMVTYDLRLMARDWLGPATRVDVEVRFGEPVTELAAVAEARGARLVVARAQPSPLALRRRSGRASPVGRERPSRAGESRPRVPSGRAAQSHPGGGPVASVTSSARGHPPAGRAAQAEPRAIVSARTRPAARSSAVSASVNVRSPRTPMPSVPTT